MRSYVSFLDSDLVFKPGIFLLGRQVLLVTSVSSGRFGSISDLRSYSYLSFIQDFGFVVYLLGIFHGKREEITAT